MAWGRYSQILSGLAWNSFPRTIRILIVGAVIVTIARSMSLPFFAIYLTTQMGFDPVTIGAIIGIGALCGTFGGLFGGTLADKLGRRPVLVVALLAAAGAMALVPVAETPLEFLALNVVLALGNAFYEPISRALLADHTSGPLRMRAFSYRYVATNVGWAIGPLLGTFAGLSGGEIAFVISGAAIALFATAFALVRATVVEGGEERHAFTVREAIAVLAADRRLRLLVIASVLAITVYGQMSVTFSQYLVANFEDGLRLFALVVVVNPITIVLLQPILMRRMERAAPARALLLGCAMLAAANLIFAVAPNGLVLAFGMFVFTIGEMLIMPGEYMLVNRLAPARYRGAYFGAHSLGDLGNLLGPWLGGMILAAHGGQVMFVALAALALACMPLYRLTCRVIEGDPRTLAA